MAPPMRTIGPSRPPEPPAPRVTAVAMIFAGMSRVGRYPPWSPAATIVSVTPPLATPGPNRRSRAHEMKSASGMASRMNHLPQPRRSSRVSKAVCENSIAHTRTAAPSPTSTPSTSAAIRNAVVPRCASASETHLRNDDMTGTVTDAGIVARPRNRPNGPESRFSGSICCF